MKLRHRFSKKDTSVGRYFFIYSNSGNATFLTFAKLEYEENVIVAMDALPKYIELHNPYGDGLAIRHNPSVEYGFTIKSEYEITHIVYELNEAEIMNNILMETI